MANQQRVTLRGGPAQYDGMIILLTEDDERLWFEASEEFGRPGAVYALTERIEETQQGPAVVFQYVAEDVPSA